MNLLFPYALFLFPLSVAILIGLQLIRSRRKEIVTGSLLIWKRVAEKVRTRKPKRVIWDRSFWLQVATLGALSLALGSPQLTMSQPPGRTLVLLLDNGPTSRARAENGKTIWTSVVDSAESLLSQLQADDRVVLVISGPTPHILGDPQGNAPGTTRDLIAAVQPCLSYVDRSKAWAFGVEAARRPDARSNAHLWALSPQAPPEAVAASATSHWQVVASPGSLSNVALTAFGARNRVAIDRQEEVTEVLVQIRHTSGQVVQKGVLKCWQGMPSGDPIQTKSVTIGPQETDGILFTLKQRPLPPLSIRWESSTGPDNLPEDDGLTAVPKKLQRPTIRIHGSAPHLKNLYESGRDAVMLSSSDGSFCDLEIFVEAVPQDVPRQAKAALFLAPATSFGPFEVRAEILNAPSPKVVGQETLIEGFPRTNGAGFTISQARLIKQAGDWDPFLEDQEGNVLGARFLMSNGHWAYVLAFVPDDGLNRSATEAFPAAQYNLIGLCLRILNEARGSDDPYAIDSARQLEAASGKPLPLDWQPTTKGAAGSAVLDHRVSTLDLGKPDEASPSLSAWLPETMPAEDPLWPYLIFMVLLLFLLESWQGKSSASKGTVVQLAANIKS